MNFDVKFQILWTILFIYYSKLQGIYQQICVPLCVSAQAPEVQWWIWKFCPRIQCFSLVSCTGSCYLRSPSWVVVIIKAIVVLSIPQQLEWVAPTLTPLLESMLLI